MILAYVFIKEGLMFISSLNTLSGVTEASLPASARGADRDKVSETDGNEAFILDLSPAACKAGQAASAERNTSLIAKAKNVEVQRRNVQKQISRILLSHNIDTSSEIKFTYEGGKVSVNGSHPQKDTIERILNENAELRSAVSGLLNDSHELASEKVQQEYTVALQNDDDEDKEKQETEMERQLRLQQKVVSFQQQLSDVSTDFSFSGGTLSVATLDMVSGFSF